VQDIFLSYSRHDSTTAESLATALSKTGWSIWIDRSAIEVGDAYDTQIEEALAQTRAVVVLWSKESVKSRWVRAEAAYALSNRKLLPVSLDGCSPPLEFLHIQTVEFTGWSGSDQDVRFSNLTTALKRILDRSAGGKDGKAPSGEPESKAPDTPLQAKPPAGLLRTRLNAFMVQIGLRFPEPFIEREFRVYFQERTYVIAQYAIMLAFLSYVIYGVADMAGNTGIMSTRFRYMIACPLILGFFGLSFTQFARRHSQLFIVAFAIAAATCVYITVVLLGIETPFRIQSGNGTMNFLLALAFAGLLPMYLSYTILVGAVLSGLHALIMLRSQIPLSQSWLNYIHVGCMWTVACSIAYWRERLSRASFAAGFH
jgi:hypothetical protein